MEEEGEEGDAQEGQGAVDAPVRSRKIMRPNQCSSAVAAATKEYILKIIDFRQWRHALSMYGVGLWVKEEAGKFSLKVHLDPWAWQEDAIPEGFKEFVRSNTADIKRELFAMNSEAGKWNLTPAEVEKHLQKWDSYDAGVRTMLYQAARDLGVISYISPEPWDIPPPLHETQEMKQRREALSFLESLDNNSRNIAGIEWEWDESPGLNWCRCTYPNGRVSVHFFVSQWWEGFREQRCDCQARRFNPNKQCKHEQARSYEWRRRVQQKDTFGI